MKNTESQKLQSRAEQVLVGGVNSPVRSFRRVGGHPIFAVKGEGAYVEDADGNRFVDLVMSYGPHLFGHAHPAIVEAVRGHAHRSFGFGLSTEEECAWGEAVLTRLPGAERVRAMSTGTEACATAVRLARGITNREIIVKFSGHYHGHVDSLMFDAGSGLATLSDSLAPESAGVPASLGAAVRVLPFNDPQAVKDCFAKLGDKIAGVIVEPVMGNMGVVAPEKGFLETLRAECDRSGALLILDEVMTGLRVSRTSAQGRYGVRPDLTTLGKIVGGGLPLAAVAGPKKHMEKLAPLGPVYQAGTLSGNPLSIAAGRAMLKLIDSASPYETLEHTGKVWCELFQAEADRRKIPFKAVQVGSMLSFYFRKEAPKNATDCRDVDQERFTKFFWAAMENGIMLPPSPFEACFLSTEHAKIPVEELRRKVSAAFDKA